MRYKVKLNAFAGNARRKVKHVEAAGFYVNDGVLVFQRKDVLEPFFAIAAGDWYQVSVVA